ncbi:MAG TPA: hypothetical protein VFC63_10670 [Blastocatellia bacterium]|nr:hypothetical protein [Blastocatellia bacterium]
MKSRKNIAESYNRRKDFEGRQYTGMTVGRTHHWYYDKSDWKEKKVTPDKWEFVYSTTKRRAGHAPEGSGVPVGTAYHWFILAHQYVEKLNANDYSTQMVGLKFKLAHKRASAQKWSASGEKRRKQLVQILKDLIADLEGEPEQIVPVALELEHNGKSYSGTAVPILTSCDEGVCQHFDITLNKKHIGVLRHVEDKWKISEMKSQALANAIGREIEEYYQ